MSQLEHAKSIQNTQIPKKTNEINEINNLICYITQTGAYIKYAQFPDSDVNTCAEIKKYFTIKTKTINDAFVQTTQCKINKNTEYIIIPRFGFFDLFQTPTLRSKKLLKKCNLTSFTKTSTNLINLNIVNKIKPGLCPNTPFQWKGEFKGNQKLVVNHILKNHYSPANIKQGNSGVIVQLDAGQGKTFLAMGMINKIQRKTLVVVHSTAVMSDWLKETTSLFPENCIGQYYGKKKIDGDIIIAVIDSLLGDQFTIRTPTQWLHSENDEPIDIKKSKLPKKEKIKEKKEKIKETTFTVKEFFSQFGFVIFDEAHEYCSAKRSTIFWRAQTTFMMGLSATPNERLNKFDPVAWWGIGPVLNAKTIEGYTEANITFTGRVQMVKYIGPETYTRPILCEKTQIISTPLMLNNMIQDRYRIEVICNEAKILYDKGLFTFIFADRCEYLSVLREKLKEMNIKCEAPELDKLDEIQKKKEKKEQKEQKEKKIVKVTGGASHQDMKQAEDLAQIILTTYQFLQTGKSIPKMNAIILATPRKSKSTQTIGRIFRLGSNYDIERQIIDIVDWGTIFKSQWYKRKKFYDEKQYEIFEKKIKYTDFEDIIENKENKEDNESDEN